MVDPSASDLRGRMRGRRRAGVPAAAVQEGEGKGAGKVEEGTRKLTAYSNQAEVGRRIELDVWG